MKKTICSLLLLLAATSSRAQCCPYMGSINTNPQAPLSTDQVKIITQATTPNQATEISKSFTVNAQPGTIELEACYYMGLLTSPFFFIDTFSVGQLGAGTYTIHFRAAISSQSVCTVTQSNTATYTFVVSTPPDAIAGHGSLGGLSLFPNPVKDKLTIELATAPLQNLKLQLQNALGQLLLEQSLLNPKQEIDLSTIPQGIYFLKINNGNGQKVFKIVKE